MIKDNNVKSPPVSLVVRVGGLTLKLTAFGGALTGLDFVPDSAERCDAAGAAPDTGCRGSEGTPADIALLDVAERQLCEYFAGVRREFDLPVTFSGTSFRRAVWEALSRIPYGEVRTYGEIAREVGCPNGARAVGGACHANPVAIIVPCHRVIGASGALTGFGGGIDVKERLLALERMHKS